MYPRLKEFMDLVRVDNPTYRRFSPLVPSTFAPLERLLATEGCTAELVNKEIDRLAQTTDKKCGTKANKYKDALYFLENTYPGVDPVKVLPHGCGATKATLYLQTGGPPTIEQVGETGIFHVTKLVQPRYEVLQVPVEEFILEHPALNPGVLLIHLSNLQPAMDKEYCGWKAVHHMRSVIRIASSRSLEHCVLYMRDPPACRELTEVLPASALTVKEEHHHSGFFNSDFESFVERHSVLVVMGFDADICVQANMFGSPDRMPDGTFPPALVNKVGVITSRPLVVTPLSGQIQTKEYGPEIYLT